MDKQILWELITKNARHIEVINREMGSVQSAVEWLTWTSRFIFGGIVISIGTSLVNLWLTKKNYKCINGNNNVQNIRR